MRVFYSQSVMRVLEGEEDLLDVVGRLPDEITPETEVHLREFPEAVQSSFNQEYRMAGHILKYVSDLIINMPDEFEFHLDLELLDRLAREMLIAGLPGDAAIWQARYGRIAELWVGGRDGYLRGSDREKLSEAMREIAGWPTEGKVFALGEDLAGIDRASARAAIRETLKGIVQESVSPSIDYFLTNRGDLGKAAKAAGAKRVIDKLVFHAMNEGKA